MSEYLGIQTDEIYGLVEAELREIKDAYGQLIDRESSVGRVALSDWQELKLHANADYGISPSDVNKLYHQALIERGME